MNIVLVVAAHTDDEALGCGGTIARHVAEGDIVYAIFMADGVTSRMNTKQHDHTKREKAAEKARKILGIQKNFYLALPDNRLDTIPLIDIIQKLEAIINELKPNIIYTHHHGDLNIDHRITHEAVMTACRPTPESNIHSIYTFEIMSSTDWANPTTIPFLPNFHIDISNYIPKKIEALKEYQHEMRDTPHSRNITHLIELARHRGNCVGINAAESFMMIRTIKKDKKNNKKI